MCNSITVVMILAITRYILIQLLYGITILLSFIFWPLCWPFRKFITAGKFMPFYILYDSEDGYYGSDTFRSERGLKRNFWTALRWSWRNPAWNFHLYFKPRQGTPQAIKVRGKLIRNGLDASYYELANIKTENIHGRYTGNFGEYFSERFSVIGKMFLVYKVRGRTYFRYSKTWFKKGKWHELHIGTNDYRYTFKYRIMRLK